jgi:hypothetical protein
MRSRILLIGAAMAAAVALTPVRANANMLYLNDFVAPATVGLGASAAFNPGGGAEDFIQSASPFFPVYGSLFFHNTTNGLTQLTLSNLPTHTGADVSFIMAFINSWDSRDGGCCSPDNLDLYIDGSKFASYTYNNALGTIKDIDGGSLLAEYVEFDNTTYYADTIVDMSGDPLLSFAHTASTLTVGFQFSGGGFQGGGDESWGIDSLRVDLSGVQIDPTPVPEPATFLLLGGPLAFFAVRRFRQR